MGCRCSKNGDKETLLSNGSELHLGHLNNSSTCDTHRSFAYVKKPFDPANQELIFGSDVRLFKLLQPDDCKLLLQVCEQLEVPAGEVVVREHDSGDFFFIVLDGVAAVVVDGVEVDTYKRGSHCGSLSLIHSERRTETIEATTTLSIIRITQQNFRKLGLHNRLKMTRRVAVGLGVGGEMQPKTPSEKTKDEARFIATAILENKHLKMLGLGEAQVQLLVNKAWREKQQEGTEIVKKGQIASCFFIVYSGEFVTQKREKKTEVHFDIDSNDASNVASSVQKPKLGDCMMFESEGTVTMDTHGGASEGAMHHAMSYEQEYEHGDSFGALELLSSIPRCATVTARCDSVVWAIAKQTFVEILRGVSHAKVEVHMEYIRGMECFQKLFAYERRELAQALMSVRFHAGDFIFEEGQPVEACHLVISGEVARIQDGVELERFLVGAEGVDAEKGNDSTGCLPCLAFQNTRKVRLKRVKAPFIVGEYSLLGETPFSLSTYKVCSTIALTLMLNQETLELMIGSLAYLQKIRAKSKFASVGRRIMFARKFAGLFKTKPRDPNDVILMRDLDKVSMLGAGGFATVELWRHKVSGKEFAMKICDKGHVTKLDARINVINEKQIMHGLKSPFTICLCETYNTRKSLCFLLELAPGGELFTIYSQRLLHGSEKHARYYGAGMACAFEYLHRKRILYRDLKSENILLNEKGHPKLGDFGLAKFSVGRTYTYCGTPEYLAPEMVKHRGCVHSVDWWCLGILIFELMDGTTPFESNNPQRMFSSILKNKPSWPKWGHGPVKDIISALLRSEPCERLPVLKGGMQNIFGHDWYEGKFDWESFRKGEMVAPYVPQVKRTKSKQLDLQNFNTIMPVKLEYPYKDDGSGWDATFATAK